MITPQIPPPARYRVSQFFAAVRASLPVWAGGIRGRLSAPDAALIRTLLPNRAQQALFARMSPNDQRHAIAVARTLQQQKQHQHPALLQAALLHDVGKSIGQPILHRVAIVLLEAFWPVALRRLSSVTTLQSESDPTAVDACISQIGWWQRPFVVHAWHPKIGAAWAQQAGCDPLVIELILRHQEKLTPTVVSSDSDADALLAALQWADNLN